MSLDTQNIWVLVSELLMYVNGECYRFCGNIHTSRHCLSWLYLSWSWLYAEEIFLYQGDEKQDGHMLPEEVLSMLWLGKLCHGCILLLLVTNQFVVKCNSMSVVAVHNGFVLLTIYLCMLLSIWWYRDSVDNTVEDNSSVFSLIRIRWLPSARVCMRHLHQRSAPVLNWRCQLSQVDLYFGRKLNSGFALEI